MKGIFRKNWFRLSVGTLIFIILFLFSLFFVRPLYGRLSKKIQDFQTKFSERLLEKTGLSVKYGSLSPSILSAINMNDISIFDAETDRKIVTIKKAVLSYRFLDLFSKHPEDGIKSLTLRGVLIEFDAEKDFGTIERLKKLLTKKDGGELQINVEDSGENSGAKKKFALSSVDFHLPCDIFIKNIVFHYFTRSDDILLNFAFLNLKDYDRSAAKISGVAFESEGKFSLRSDKLKKNGERALVSCAIELEGSLFPRLEGSSATVGLSEVRSADYSLSHFEFLANYGDSKLQIRSVRSIIPISLFALLDLENAECAVSADFKELNPFSVVLIKEKPAFIEKIDGSLFSGSAELSLAGGNLSYTFGVSSVLDERAAGVVTSLDADFSGDANFVSINNVSVRSENVSADFSGQYNIRKMQPSGILNLDYFRLKNGGSLSSEVYLDAYKDGITCFSPQIFISSPQGDEIALTAAQLNLVPKKDSVDFALACDDYSHVDFGSPAHLEVDGSYMMGANRFVQASVSVRDLFLDSVLKTVEFFVPNTKSSKIDSAKKFLSSIVFSGDIYVSSDFKDIVYNSSDCIFANVKNENQLLLLAVDGSNETFQINQLDFQFGAQSIHATAGVDMHNGFEDFSFNTNISFNSLPYSFSGNFSSGLLSVSGDYDFVSMIMHDSDLSSFSGSLSFSSLPVSLGKNIFMVSTLCSLSWKNLEDFTVVVQNLELEESSSKLQFSPHVYISGNIDRSGFSLDRILYSDAVSILEGQGRILVDTPLGVFESIRTELELSNAASPETISLSAEFSNDAHLPFSFDVLKNEFKLSANLAVNEMPVARVMKDQNLKDSVTAQIVASGTLARPFVSVSLSELSLFFNGYPLRATASVIYDESGINVYEFNSSWANFSVCDVSAYFDPKDFSGSMSAVVDAAVMQKKIHVPLEFSISGTSGRSGFSLPEFMTASVKSSGVSGDFTTKSVPFDFTIMKSPQTVEVFTKNTEGFRAVFSESGAVSATVGKNNFFSFDLNGVIEKEKLNLTLSNLRGNLGAISKNFNIPFVDFSSGMFEGNVKISGFTTDPEFFGTVELKNAQFNIPLVSKSAMKAEKAVFRLNQDAIFLSKTPVSIGRGVADLNGTIALEGWTFDDIQFHITTHEKKPVPINMKFPLVRYKGSVGADLDFDFRVPEFLIYVKGDVYGEKGDLDIVVSKLQSEISTIAFASFLEDTPRNAAKRKPAAIVDIKVHAGQRFQLMFNPLLRCIVSPKTVITLQLDSESGDFFLGGDLELKGGEIMWLNRNFYLRSGKIELNETSDQIDPIITVKAETREHDDAGNRVTLTLSALRQRLSEFAPKFSASPPKSEAEIMALLGQAISGDADGAVSLVASGGDFLVQTVVLRKIENALRDIFNFDIFSIRTNIIQNALKINSRTNKKDTPVTVGNYFDNTTVYIGKYFGSSIYVDAMLNISYDETKTDELGSVNGLVFQPEFGFEMESPFVNIRFGFAPNFKSILDNSWLPSTSITLSWKYDF